MKAHDLTPAPGSRSSRKRVARGIGGKGGKTAGRGTKGQGARDTIPVGFEGGQMPLHMRVPKLKGFKNPNKVPYQVVSVAALGALFPNGGEVSIADLVNAGAVRKNQPVKVLGNGEISVALQVSANAFSQSAKDKLAAAGGTAVEV